MRKTAKGQLILSS